MPGLPSKNANRYHTDARRARMSTSQGKIGTKQFRKPKIRLEELVLGGIVDQGQGVSTLCILSRLGNTADTRQGGDEADHETELQAHWSH